ncbi:MAG: hypothetical protein NVS3B21_27720 [Acidimicrobiales bacterium]
MDGPEFPPLGAVLAVAVDPQNDGRGFSVPESGVLSVAEAVATATANGRNVKRTDPTVRVGEHGDPPISLRVVIVDDNDSIRRMLKTAADMVGGIEIVGEATNGQDAVEVSTALRPHAVVLDVEMPVMDGVSAIAPIRAATPATTVVMFSSDTSRRTEALAEGASGYFEKGIMSPLAVLREIVTLWNQLPAEPTPRSSA